MILTELEVSFFRIIEQASLQPHEALNLITGNNGSGKSSLLEAIQCLSTGHSFRTRKSRELISHTQPSYRVTALFSDPATERSHRAGLERHRDGSTSLRLDFEEIKSLAQITKLLPLKALTPESHRLIQDGPDQRRQFLDWGVFHVEPRFLEQWRTFKRCLIQRNQLLRDGGSDQEIKVWDELFVDSANAIDGFRKSYVMKLAKFLEQRLMGLEGRFHVELKYRGGWSAEHDLKQALEKNLNFHRKMKTTTDGPHRAELVISADDNIARQVLSRGQQKVLVYLLHLSQLDVLTSTMGTQAIVLCDDLESELDDYFSHQLIEQLMSLGSQVFVSGIKLGSMKAFPHRGFHVERGVVQNIV